MATQNISAFTVFEADLSSCSFYKSDTDSRPICDNA